MICRSFHAPGEAFIASHRTEGWACCLREHYDDGGILSRKLDRPPILQLMVISKIYEIF